MKALKPVALSLFLLTAFLWFGQSHAAAASYCGVLAAAAQQSSPPSRYDCLTYGQDYTALTSLSGTSDQLKAQFINKMHSFESGQHLQQVGATTIEAGLYRHSDMTWDARINMSDVTLKIVGLGGTSGYPFTKNSAYDPASDQDITYSDSQNHIALEFIVNGTVYYAIKLDCGNYEGTLPGLPQPAHWTLQGDTYVRVNSNSYSLSGANANPQPQDNNDEVDFKHEIHNNGPDDTTNDYPIKWRVEGCYHTNAQGACASSDYSSSSGGGCTLSNNTDFGGSDTDNSVPNGSRVMSAAIVSTYHFSCKSGAGYGDRYCQRVAYYYANGPDQYPDYRAHSNASCAILQKPGVPSGTIACSNSTGPWVVSTTTNISDPDHPTGPYSVDLYKDGVKLSPSPFGSTSSTGSYSTNVDTYVPAGSTHTFYLIVYGVDANAVKDGKNAQTNTVTCGAPVTSGNCGGVPLSNNIVLPDGASPSSSGNQGPNAPADTNSAYSTYYQEVPGNQTITDAHDQYSGPTKITWSPSGSQPKQTVFTLDYTNYKNDYGYDDHSTTVYYNQDFAQTVWTTGSSPSYYTCGGVRQGSALCPYTGTPDGWSCPSGYTNNNNGTCSKTYTGVKGSCFGALCNYTCNSGDSGGGLGNPTCTHTVSGTANHWTCGGGIGGGSSSTCYYLAQQWFVYTRGGSSTVTSPNNQYGGAPQFPECYDRGFAVNNVSVTVSLTDSNGTPDSEDPDNANSGASVSLTFGFPAGTPGAKGFRVGPKVSVNYSGSFTNCSGGSVGGVITLSGPDNLASSQLPYTTSATLPGGTCTLPQPVIAGQTFCAAYSVSPPGSQMKNTGAITVASPGSVLGSGCSVPISNLPYAHFWGLDVSAGGAFATGVDECATAAAQQSGIAAFVKGAGPLTRGSGAQFGALALGAVDTSTLSAGFGSAVLRPSGNNPTGRDGLTFANKGTLGNMAVNNHCVPDYFGTNPLDTPSAPAGNAIDMSPFSTSTTTTPQDFYYGFGSGSQYNINGFSIPGTGINDANHIAIYVNGDVYIQNDIRFENSAWASTAQIPSFYLIVKGNIYIGPGVHQLDGVYVAQPDSGRGGTINTCAPGFNRYANGDLFNNCSSQLVVNGAFAAQNVELSRTYASLRNSIGGEYPATPAVGNCTLGDKGAGVRVANNYDCAAEIFMFSPETYLSIPAISPTSNPNDGRFDYITSLSPVL